MPIIGSAPADGQRVDNGMLTVDVILLIAAAVLTGALLLLCGWPLPISRSLTGALAVIMAVVGLGLMLLVFKDASMKVNTALESASEPRYASAGLPPQSR